MPASRRDFIRRSAQLAALAAMGVALPEEASGAVRLPDGLHWQKAPCRFCGTGCGVMVGVQDGRVVAVQGDPDNGVNKGLLCAKGYHAGGILYGKDRLTHPMIRKNGVYEKVSWDDAIELIADSIMADPDRFSIYGSGQWTVPEGYQNSKFIKAGLSNNHLEPNARLCMASAAVGLITTFGVDEPSGCYEDLDECDTVITWGNNWAEMHPVLFSRFMDRKKALPKFQSARMTYIDMATRKTRSTQSADTYMEFVPQTDMVIANCICYQLLNNDTYDKEFVAKHTRFQADDGSEMSLEAFRVFLEDYTIEKASALSGVSVGSAQRLRNGPGSGDLRPCAAFRSARGQRRTPQGMRGSLERRTGFHQPEAGLPYGTDV